MISCVSGQLTAALRRQLLGWFRQAARDLPWRRTRDPYCIWLSEVLLQQTRVDQGLPYYERFMEAFPSVQALAAAKEEHVLKLWEGLGYYARARHLHEAAKRIVHERGGRLPSSADEWRTLPGVGRYTAAAIASIAYGERVAVLDGNVVRVLARVFDIEECVDAHATREALWELGEALVPARAPGAFNQAMMELGARVCTPKAPQCEACPVRRHCLAQKAGTVASRPVRKARRFVPHYDVVAAAILRNGRYLLAKRPAKGLLGGLWEFPGGKVELGESHAEALRREVREELDIEIAVGERLACVDHAYSHFTITLTLYRCTLTGGTPVPTVHTALRWPRRSELSRYALPGATKKLLGHL